MADKSFLQELILNEIKGKNAAIHAYDRMSWTVRSGFLTLFFAAWGLVLGGMVKSIGRRRKCCQSPRLC